ncbi:HEAT repeat protein [Kineothrix alysoides]|uniref:HEAT repeat protein n=1 Tax=Kineothrix alysoides TaxID=1469948 RepID=A0A4R1QP85_9FIRM|nr:HEAT repeat domain-containing protein [Kineothrix alysoides]TCL54105.1 HEAT repeat protein [Kineothrix alysoides]
MPKEEREQYKLQIENTVLVSMKNNVIVEVLPFFSDSDTYVRKVAYQAVRMQYKRNGDIRLVAIPWLKLLYKSESALVRQTVIYACGEIAAFDFPSVEELLTQGMHDPHHSVRNAMIGSLKISGDKNSEILAFCEKYILSDSPEVRRLICHGLELKGRTHPQEIIALLKKLQYDKHPRVKEMLVHVLGQISYKKGCFHFVEGEVFSWNNADIYKLFQKEVIEVHGRYEKFSALPQKEVIAFFAAKTRNED